MPYPKELSALRQWICWRLEPDPKSDKPRKVPYDPKTGRKASSTNPDTWATLAEALVARDKYLFTGIGFVFTAECGIVGVDIDHCRNKDGSFTDVAKAILEKACSYTEVSPSGSGLHIFLRGVMPGKGNKNSTSGVEMYAAARYFTMTGNRVEGTPEAIADGKDILPWIHENYIAKKSGKKAKAKKTLRTVSLTDEQVLEKARAAQNGDEFSSLWDGSWEGRFGSQSEADLSLCCSLAFWTGKNKEQMDRLFRQSKLFREKWDKVHHADGATYGEETLDQAIARTENVYTPGGELGIYEANGRYMRERGENVYALTNFVVHPLEMLEAEDETQMTCDLVTMYGETFRLSFMTSDFSSAQKFKAVLNRRTISLCYMGSDGDLEVLKSYISGLDWQHKRGYTALGLHERDGRWVYVSRECAKGAGGEDIIRHDYNEAKGKLIVWLFNDPSFYSAKAWKLTAKYDFGRKPNDEDGNPTDKKQKLLVGLYREPFRDGWKYTINEKVHPEMVDTVLNYIFFGFQKNEDGEMEPFTYLRHNRKALGIYYLFDRYVEHCKRMKEWISRTKKTDVDYRAWFSDYSDEPYFPTPQTYKGYNIATKWDGTSYYAGIRRYRPNSK